MRESQPYYPIVSDIVDVTGGKIAKYFKCINCLYINFNEFDVILANHNLTVYPVWVVTLLRMNFSKNYYYVQAYETDFYPTNALRRLLASLTYKLPFKKVVNADIFLNYKLC